MTDTDDWTTPTDEHDWSAPTGEYERPLLERASADVLGPAMADEEIDPVFGLTPGELRMVDAFFYELAMDAANDPRPPTAAEVEAIADLRARADHLKAMTPEELEAERERLRRVL